MGRFSNRQDWAALQEMLGHVWTWWVKVPGVHRCVVLHLDSGTRE